MKEAYHLLSYLKFPAGKVVKDFNWSERFWMKGHSIKNYEWKIFLFRRMFLERIEEEFDNQVWVNHALWRYFERMNERLNWNLVVTYIQRYFI